MPLPEALAKNKVQFLGEDMFQQFINDVLEAVPPFDGVSSLEDPERASFGIAYTPLHGVGAVIAEQLLRRRGFSSVWTVPEQREPDGNFPTVEFPNPEEVGATDLVMALADKHFAPIAIANDPDADRLCICARDRKGIMRQMTGDHLGSLLGDALIQRALAHTPAERIAVRSTIVSSRILARLAKKENVEHRETLTGFKWLGPSASRVVEKGNKFIFAYEEALGYMVSDVVYDKDGLSALVAITELSFQLHKQGKTLWDRLEEIHQKVGLSITMQRTIKLQPGTSGDAIMKRLRNEPRTSVGSFEIALTDDLLQRPHKSQAGEEDIPQNDVLRYYIRTPGADVQGSQEIMLAEPRIIVRPSGTEPKVKIYCELLGSIKSGETYEEASKRSTKELTTIVDTFHAWMSGSESSSSTLKGGQSHQQQRPSWFQRISRTFPFVVEGEVPVLSPPKRPLPAKPILFVAPSHPFKQRQWASKDPTCLYWQMQLALRGIDFHCEYVQSDFTSSTYQGEGFSNVPLLLDTDGTVVQYQYLPRWADAAATFAAGSTSSPEAKALESLLEGPILAGVVSYKYMDVHLLKCEQLLELFLLPEPAYASSAPIFSRMLQRSLAWKSKKRLASHIMALNQASPTQSVPGWSTSFHGLLGGGAGSLNLGDTGNASTAEEEFEEQTSVDITKLNYESIRREASEALSAVSLLTQGISNWLNESGYVYF